MILRKRYLLSVLVIAFCASTLPALSYASASEVSSAQTTEQTQAGATEEALDQDTEVQNDAVLSGEGDVSETSDDTAQTASQDSTTSNADTSPQATNDSENPAQEKQEQDVPQEEHATATKEDTQDQTETSEEQNAASENTDAQSEKLGSQANTTSDNPTDTSSKEAAEEPKKDGWEGEGAERVYYKDGKVLLGEQVIDGKTYLFDKKSGKVKTGWQNKRYFDPTTAAMLTGLQTIDNKLYLFDAKTGERVSGLKTHENKSYYFDEKTGAALSGWKTISKQKYYFDPKTYEMAVGGKKIDGKFFVFGTDGVQQTKQGWVKVGKDWYYLNKDASAFTGWKKLKGTWYYMDKNDNARMKANEVFSDGKATYVARSSGACPANAWVKINNDWYRTGGSCAVRKGWAKISGVWYYLDPNNSGRMMANEVFSDGKATYVARSSGACPAYAWVKINDDWYRTGGSCAVVKGWYKSGGKWYYLLPSDNGRMARGLIKVQGKEYFLYSPNGDMAANSYVNLPDGSRAYASSSGALGVHIKGNVYTDANGKFLQGWIKSDGKWMFIDGTNGMPTTGWLKDKGKTYWLDDTGYMVTGRKTIDNKVYNFASSGELVKSGWQNPENMFQVTSKRVSLPSYMKGRFGYTSPVSISADASKKQVIDAFVKRARDYIGTTYVWDYACAPGVGVDCSGLVLQCLYAVGVDAGRYTPYDHYFTKGHDHYANDMSKDNHFKSVSLKDRQVGDLIFYPGHVAIYIGNNKIIHAYGPGGVNKVIISDMYFSNPTGCRRPFV